MDARSVSKSNLSPSVFTRLSSPLPPNWMLLTPEGSLLPPAATLFPFSGSF